MRKYLSLVFLVVVLALSLMGAGLLLWKSSGNNSIRDWTINALGPYRARKALVSYVKQTGNESVFHVYRTALRVLGQLGDIGRW